MNQFDMLDFMYNPYGSNGLEESSEPRKTRTIMLYFRNQNGTWEKG